MLIKARRKQKYKHGHGRNKSRTKIEFDKSGFEIDKVGKMCLRVLRKRRDNDIIHRNYYMQTVAMTIAN